MYVVIIIETKSSTPGIDRVWGPYHTEAHARDIQRITRQVFGRSKTWNPELVQVAKVEEL